MKTTTRMRKVINRQDALEWVNGQTNCSTTYSTELLSKQKVWIVTLWKSPGNYAEGKSQSQKVITL